MQFSYNFCLKSCRYNKCGDMVPICHYHQMLNIWLQLTKRNVETVWCTYRNCSFWSHIFIAVNTNILVSPFMELSCVLEYLGTTEEDQCGNCLMYLQKLQFLKSYFHSCKYQYLNFSLYGIILCAWISGYNWRRSMWKLFDVLTEIAVSEVIILYFYSYEYQYLNFSLFEIILCASVGIFTGHIWLAHYLLLLLF